MRFFDLVLVVGAVASCSSSELGPPGETGETADAAAAASLIDGSANAADAAIADVEAPGDAEADSGSEDGSAPCGSGTTTFEASLCSTIVVGLPTPMGMASEWPPAACGSLTATSLEYEVRCTKVSATRTEVKVTLKGKGLATTGLRMPGIAILASPDGALTTSFWGSATCSFLPCDTTETWTYEVASAISELRIVLGTRTGLAGDKGSLDNAFRVKWKP